MDGCDVNYKITEFFRLNTGVEHIGLWDYRQGNSTTWSKRNRYRINIKLDVLYKDPYESLNLILGGYYATLYNRTNDIDPVYDEEGPLGGAVPNQNLGVSRTMRQLRYFSFNLGLEWRDYITPHFGYLLGLAYNPLVRTTTHSLLFERVALDGQTHPMEGKRITPGEDGYPLETYAFRFVNLNFGLTYQW